MLTEALAISLHPPVIRARGLSKLYREGSAELRALSNIDLDILAGQLTLPMAFGQRQNHPAFHSWLRPASLGRPARASPPSGRECLHAVRFSRRSAEAYGVQRFSGHLIRVGKILGRKNVRTEEPSERVDTKILETLMELHPGQKLPVGLPVDAYVQGNTNPAKE